MSPLPTGKAGVVTVDAAVADSAVPGVFVVGAAMAVAVAEVTVSEGALDVMPAATGARVLSPPQAVNDSVISVLERKTE